ncbi:retrotransposon gag protein [Cucumis melo var. makuwa]|nr:retrotransposon gag protein [Cucumis melo var. makuwa]
MALRKVASKATVPNDSYTGLVTQSHSKRSMQEQEQSSVLKKKSWEQLIKSPKGKIIFRENPLFNNWKQSFSTASIALEQLPEKQLIQMPECKRPEQVGKADDPNYYKYHQVISHPVEKCFVLKEPILRLAHEKKIELDLEEVAQTNHATITIMSEALSPRLIYDQRESLIQFGTFKPIHVRFQQRRAY